MMTTVVQGDERVALTSQRAATVAGISMRRLRYWERSGLVGPSVTHVFGQRGSTELYAFHDMIELLVVARLRDELSLQHVRRVVSYLRDRGYDSPLRQLRFARVGNEIYFQHPDGTWEGDLSPKQIVFHQVINLEPLRSQVRESTKRPPQAVGRITSKRGRLGSKPVFEGTRIPVSTVRKYLAAGRDEKAILRAYPSLTAKDVAAARRSRASA